MAKAGEVSRARRVWERQGKALERGTPEMQVSGSFAKARCLQSCHSAPPAEEGAARAFEALKEFETSSGRSLSCTAFL